MNETVNQENGNIETPKTFTQEEVNAIVADRLDRERKKYDGFEELKAKAAKFDEIEEANKSELQKANERAQALEAELSGLKKADEIRNLREKVAKETGVPANLLSGDDEDSCKVQAEAIKEIVNKGNAYPQLRDGGEVTNTIKSSPREEFRQYAAAMNE